MIKFLDASKNKSILTYILNNARECIVETKGDTLILRGNKIYMDGSGIYNIVKVINHGLGNIPKCIVYNPNKFGRV